MFVCAHTMHYDCAYALGLDARTVAEHPSVRARQWRGQYCALVPACASVRTLAHTSPHQPLYCPGRCGPPNMRLSCAL